MANANRDYLAAAIDLVCSRNPEKRIEGLEALGSQVELSVEKNARTGTCSHFAFFAAVVSKDVDANVRSKALEIASKSQGFLAEASTFTSALSDASVAVRLNAYGTLAVPQTFIALCQALSLETDTTVREAAFYGLAAMAQDSEAFASEVSESSTCTEATLLTALGDPSMAPPDVETALTQGEYFASLSACAFDSRWETTCAALSAFRAFLQSPWPSVARRVDDIVTSILSTQENQAVRASAVQALYANPGGINSARCVSTLSNEARLGSVETLHNVIWTLASRQSGSLEAFKGAVTCLREIRVRLCHAEAQHSRDSDLSLVDFETLSRAIETLVARNYCYAALLDLASNVSDRLLPYYGRSAHNEGIAQFGCT